MKKHVIKPADNYIWYIEEVSRGKYEAKEGIYLGSYQDFLDKYFAIVTPYADISSLVVRHIPEADIFEDKIAAIIQAGLRSEGN